MILSTIKKPLRYIRNIYRGLAIERQVNQLFSQQMLMEFDTFDFNNFKSKVSGFIGSMQTDGVHYRYSASSSKPTLYASAYACMTISLLGDLQYYSDDDKHKWASYFDSFQSADDGLFYDSAVMNDIYAETDWWGARHLALHMISAYTDLGLRPKYAFTFLKKYYDTAYIQSWLDEFDWQGESIGARDVDNKIMNIGCLLQYQRDFWVDKDAGKAVEFLKHYLRDKINKKTGVWGGFDTDDPNQRSRMVQFAYHLLPIFIYDKDFNFDHETIVGNVLKTQNKFGGYGVQFNSSACEDIDSIDILIRFFPYLSETLKSRVNLSISSGLKWVMLNQTYNKGFVFRLNEPFFYGSDETSSLTNCGAMLPTWFRVLSIAYITKHLTLNQNFVITTCPGYEIQ